MAMDTEDSAREGSTHATLEDAGDGESFAWSSVAHLLTHPANRRALITAGAGVTVLAWPHATGFVLVAGTALALILVGISDLFATIRSKSRWVDAARSVVMVAAGASVFVFGESSFRLIALGLGAMFVLRGLLDIVPVVRRSNPTGEKLWPLIRGSGQIAVGAAVAASPSAVLVVAVAALAASWIFAGLLTLSNIVAAGGSASSRDAPTVTTIEWLRSRDLGSDARQVVIDKLIFEGAERRTRMLRFTALMLFSTAIATFGVQADSTAVVIGAMLIAPLMTPIMATSASLLMGWPVRALRSIALVAFGVAVAIGTSWILTKYAPDIVAIGTNSQVTSRVSPTLLDLMVAVAAGGAGAYATSRTDVSDSLPGVAIAVALVPPLTVVGVSLHAGEFGFAAGAFLLFLTNLVGIVLAAGVVLVLVGFAPWFHLEARREQVKQSFAVVAIALLVIAIPLAFTGDQILSAATDERTVDGVVESWIGDAEVVVADITVEGDTVAVTLVGSDDVPKPTDLAKALAVRLERAVDLDLRIIPEARTRVSADP